MNPKTQEVWWHVNMSCFATILKQCQTIKDIITTGASSLIQDTAAFGFL